MNTTCPACRKQLKLSAKMLESIQKLGPGKSIRIKCPGCSKPIVLDGTALSPPGRAPASPASPATPATPSAPSAEGRRRPGTASAGLKIIPPAPPDISWLEEGVFDEEQVIEDVPLAMILMEDSESRDTIIESIEGIGYKTEIVKNSQEAMEKMQFVEYSSVVLHSRYEGYGLESSIFHQYMCDMSMARRRFIFYTLVGREFKTLYNLQALAYSANLVVNEKEIPYFNVIIRKAIPEYEELFGPITEELRMHGK
jgi:hypothetical protein